MEQKIIEMAYTQGLWAVLFVALLFYVLKDQANVRKEQAQRESRLITCVEKFTEEMITRVEFQEVCNDVKEVRDDVKELKGKVGL